MYISSCLSRCLSRLRFIVRDCSHPQLRVYLFRERHRERHEEMYMSHMYTRELRLWTIWCVPRRTWVHANVCCSVLQCVAVCCGVLLWVRGVLLWAQGQDRQDHIGSKSCVMNVWYNKNRSLSISLSRTLSASLSIFFFMSLALSLMSFLFARRSCFIHSLH